MSDRPKNTTGALQGEALLPQSMRRSLPIALLQAREAVMARFRPMLAAHDITEQQWRVLRVLAEAGALEATELAHRALLLAPSLTRILKTLEERALVTRARHESDGRRTLIEISPCGLDLIRAVAPESAAIYAEIEERLGEEPLRAVLDQLEALIDRLSE